VGLGLACFLCVLKITVGDGSAADFTTFVTYWLQLQLPLIIIAYSIDSIQEDYLATERLSKVLLEDTGVKDEETAAEMVVDRGKIKFDHVMFRYNSKGTIATLSNMSFCVQPGKTVALVSPTGGGKSTIQRLLYQIDDPTSGEISIDCNVPD
jgi:ABC-type multidrug transport system fused ATPase/permease subunit